ncbi:carbohydrate ABC transporter permease [Microbacterium aoyamense]|uniref:Carbohydrate ABC transporter permease n=1 Tax=Microbacterium aoyamense TaxID=344166 RepID=A0ABN2PH88_9MICO|nr:carbohydrate ABC transporter permease [Microbacterium aoyamense]
MFEARTLRMRLLLQLIVTVLALPFLLPLIVMVSGSLQGQGWGNYVAVLEVPNFFLFFRNSIVIAVITVVIVYICALLAAFAFSKLRIRAREVFFWMLLITLTLPEVVLLTPLFSTTIALGIYDTYWAVILPLAALQIPFAVLLTRNFIDGIPDDIFAAARIDGANTVGVFWHIVLPLTRPVGAAIVVFTLIGAWNAYLLPLTFLQSPDVQTVTQVPQYFIGQFSNDQTKVLASAVIIVIPQIVAYLSLQRLFERGLSAGALK